jgi:hypothetical protein
VQVVYPEARAYLQPPSFSGAWQGKLNRKQGKLQIGELKSGEYFGNFTAEDGELDIALLLEQSLALSANGAQLPSNRLLFTWQDGGGERGHGWLMIDEAGAELEGSSGFGERIDGFSWNFSR